VHEQGSALARSGRRRRGGATGHGSAYWPTGAGHAHTQLPSSLGSRVAATRAGHERSGPTAGIGQGKATAWLRGYGGVLMMGPCKKTMVRRPAHTG
jgi:hypothetical protein